MLLISFSSFAQEITHSRDEKAVVIESASVEKLHSADYLKVKDICKAVGGK